MGGESTPPGAFSPERITPPLMLVMTQAIASEVIQRTFTDWPAAMTIGSEDPFKEKWSIHGAGGIVKTMRDEETEPPSPEQISVQSWFMVIDPMVSPGEESSCEATDPLGAYRLQEVASSLDQLRVTAELWMTVIEPA